MTVKIDNLNCVEKYFLRCILKKVMMQGGHIGRITNLYQMIWASCHDRFTEDNIPTTSCILRECFDAAEVCAVKDAEAIELQTIKDMETKWGQS